MSEVKRKKGESFEAFMRRTKRLWQRSGKILQAKKIRYYAKKPAKNVQRTQTVTRNAKQSKTAYLQKIGKMPIEERPFRR